jgi:hypothetical protein
LTVGLLVGPAPALAQGGGNGPTSREYPRLPFDGDLEALLREKLRQAQGREEFDKLLKEMVRDSQKGGLDQNKLEELLKYKDNPLVQQQLEKARQDAGKLNLDLKEVEKLKQTIDTKKLQEALQKQQVPPSVKPPAVSGRLPPPRSAGPAQQTPRQGGQAPPAGEAGGNFEDRFSDWLRDRMHGLENSRVGDLLRESPAFRKGLIDLQQAMLERRGDGLGLASWDAGDWASRLHLPGDWSLPRLENSWLNLKDLPTPSLPRVNLGFGKLGSWHLPAPRVGSPGSGGLGGAQVFLWVLIVAALGLLLWRAVRGRSVPAALAAADWQLGPWPVHPSHVRSRADLVRAFDHLSLLLLGPAARTWNHVEVAEGLAAVPEQAAADRQQAVGELAGLYERARYAPEDEPLPDEALATARRDLCLLAGVADRGGPPA